MKSTRREFIGKLGVLLAGLLASRCGASPWTQVTGYVTMGPSTPSPTPETPSPTPTPEAPPPPPPPDLHWAALRDCWFDLSDRRLQSFEETAFSQDLRRRHSDSLEALVAAGELAVDVAGEIDVAFGHAIAHIQQQQVTCYIALPPVYHPREDLMQQAALLEEMATRSEVDPTTVALAQTALGRDIAWLAQLQAGEVPGNLGQVEVDPTSAEAARILVELLLGAH